MLAEYKKTIAAVVGAAVSVAATYGLNVDPSVTVLVTSLLTAVAVWWVSNKPVA